MAIRKKKQVQIKHPSSRLGLHRHTPAPNFVTPILDARGVLVGHLRKREIKFPSVDEIRPREVKMRIIGEPLL